MNQIYYFREFKSDILPYLGLLFIATGVSILICFDTKSALMFILGSVGCLLYVFLCFKKPFFAFLFLIFFASTESLSGIQLLKGVSAMIALGLMFVSTWVLRIVTKKKTFVRCKEYWPLLGFGSIVLISSIVNFGGPAGLRPALSYVQQILLVILIINFVKTSKDLKALGLTIIVSSLLVALMVVIPQFIYLPNLSFNFEVQYMGSANLSLVTRSSGFFNDPNFTCAQLVLALPFIIEWRSILNRRLSKALLLISLGIVLLAILYTYSLGGMIGLLFYLFIKVLFFSRNKLYVKVGIIAVTVPIIFTIYNTVFPIAFKEKIQMNLGYLMDYIETNDSSSLESFGTARGDVWRATILSLKRSPLVGYGAGNGKYANMAYTRYGIKDYAASHNMFLTIASDLGLIGLGFFTYLLIRACLFALPIKKRTGRYFFHQEFFYSKAIFASIFACIIMGLGLDLSLLKLPWILMGTAIVCNKITCPASFRR